MFTFRPTTTTTTTTTPRTPPSSPPAYSNSISTSTSTPTQTPTSTSTSTWQTPRIFHSRTLSQSSRTARHVLKSPDRPIAIRNEYLTEIKTKLIIWPRGDDYSASAFEIEDEDGILYFSASGRKFNKGNGRSCREFRDESGLPLFELHCKPPLFRNYWLVTLPGGRGNKKNRNSGSGSGSSSSNINNINNSSNVGSPGNDGIESSAAGSIAIGTKQRLGEEIEITFDNAAAADTKRGDEKKLTLRVLKVGNVLRTFDVVDGDRKIAQIVESIRHNERLALMHSSRPGYRPVLDVVVVPNVDLALVSFFFFFFFLKCLLLYETTANSI